MTEHMTEHMTERMTEPRLPGQLPGRESDDALAAGVAALDATRQEIAAHMDATQGAWLRKPPWLRMLPLALALVAAAAWSAWLVVQASSSASSAASASSALAWIAGGIALAALAWTPTRLARAERASLAALLVALVAAVVECVLSFTAQPAPATLATLPVDNVACARAICAGAVVPIAFIALYLRWARTPARFLHVAAIGVAGALTSMAAVWHECPATAFDHVTVSHVVVPAVAVIVVVTALRRTLTGAKKG